jgi:hypothetical protein
MPKSLSTIRTPEDEELEKKQDELRSAEAELVEKELELSSLQAELLQFRGLYILKVGWLQVELDLLRAERLRRVALHHPEDADAERKAQEAERQAGRSRSEFDSAQAETAPYVNRIEPTLDLREIYRRLAKNFHPDLADLEEDIDRRTKLMARINAAYAAGDLEALKQIELDAEMAPENVKGHDLAARLLRIIRMIYQVNRRIEEINDQISKLKWGDDWRLYVQWKQSKEWGVDILEQMARKLRAKIAAERERQSGTDIVGEMTRDLRATITRKRAWKRATDMLKQVTRNLRAKLAPKRARGAKRRRRAVKGSRPRRGRKK